PDVLRLAARTQGRRTVSPALPERGLLDDGTQASGLAALKAWPGLLVARIRGGELGSLPVVVGLLVIWTVFQILNPAFLSSRNLVLLTMQSAAIGTIALGVVLVLLVGEIDLSVGSVSGLAAAILAVGFVQLRWPLVLAVLA